MIQKEFIRSELRYRYPNLTDHLRAPQQPVGRPLLFESGTRKFGARIIVCTAVELDSLTGVEQTEPLFLCIGMPSTDSLAAYDVCVLPEQEHPGVVLNFVQRLFDRLDDWTQSLRQAAETGVTVENLLIRAADMLQNPIVLLDERGHIVAKSIHLDLAIIMQFTNTDLVQGIALEQNVVYRFGEASSPDALFTHLQSGTSHYTLLCAANDRPLYASDEIVFESLSGYLRLMLSQRTLLLGNQRKRRENEAAVDVFRALLSQDQPEKPTIEKLSRLGWSEKNDYAVLAIEPEDRDLSATRADAICDALEDSLDACCAFTVLPVIVTLVRTELLVSEKLQDKLIEIASNNNLRIGVCEAFLGLTYLPQRLLQAKRALNNAAEHGGVARYSDEIDREIIKESIVAFPRELICMRSVLALTRFDQVHGTSYLQTAERYVKNHFNAVKTAGELFIHRSTFLYRLERIKAQFGLDLDDGNLSLLHLLLSLEIAKKLPR